MPLLYGERHQAADDCHAGSGQQGHRLESPLQRMLSLRGTESSAWVCGSLPAACGHVDAVQTVLWCVVCMRRSGAMTAKHAEALVDTGT